MLDNSFLMAKIAGLGLIGERHTTLKNTLKSGVATCGGVAWRCGKNLWDALPVSATAVLHHKCTVLPVAEVW
jgi:hypothetical protein